MWNMNTSYMWAYLRFHGVRKKGLISLNNVTRVLFWYLYSGILKSRFGTKHFCVKFKLKKNRIKLYIIIDNNNNNTSILSSSQSKEVYIWYSKGSILNSTILEFSQHDVIKLKHWCDFKRSYLSTLIADKLRMELNADSISVKLDILHMLGPNCHSSFTNSIVL